MFTGGHSTSGFVGLCLEGFFFGLYSAIFAMYLQHQAATEKSQNILFYPICILYVLSVAIVVLDVYKSFPLITGNEGSTLLHLYFLLATMISCCDFMSQSILIYRCWVVWGYKIRVVIIPSILAVAYLAIWLAINGSMYLSPDQLLFDFWANVVVLTSIIISLIVNALVTGLIVFKIFKVYRESNPPWSDQKSDATGGSKLRSIIFVLIESGMIMFALQLFRVVLSIIAITNYTSQNIFNGANLLIGINQMLYGITPTIILVRVSMGLSYHDEKSMEEATVSLCFAFDSNPTLGSQESKYDIDVQRLGGDIQLVERLG